ncbi:hypothetical protein GLV94_02600 [Virgibacillus halodenitrificans]|uniref:Uncharacterized protein n=1 Tax=Virgibacillus halodenitrificans TaxID=1482 RepID=A0ABR7VL13_VIRHA|nr:hypothetical protein [Virgibacillus halodenitrificans]MBD1222383.1 hypothetical protein [Virgibacillus halodenitrificans]MYL44523.1 hypothetical protein [Virgibacillus halodenitrificans]MYL56710.1 hypothetical protein [Virgibacillus halodenitrificans]
MNSDNENEDEINEEEIKSNVEEYLFKNYEDIETLEIEDIYTNPMGGLTVDGTVNGHAEYSLGINSDLGVSSIGVGQKFPNRKEECKDRNCE